MPFLQSHLSIAQRAQSACATGKKGGVFIIIKFSSLCLFMSEFVGNASCFIVFHPAHWP